MTVRTQVGHRHLNTARFIGYMLIALTQRSGIFSFSMGLLPPWAWENHGSDICRAHEQVV